MQIETEYLPEYSNFSCLNLLGLYFTDPDCSDDKYIHAYSFDKNVLIDLINKHVTNEKKKYYSIEQIQLYKYIEVAKSDSTDNLFGKKNICGLITCASDEHFFGKDEIKFGKVQNKIYGYNKKNKITNIDEQSLLICESKNFSNNLNISYNPVLINKFYEEGIMNG